MGKDMEYVVWGIAPGHESEGSRLLVTKLPNGDRITNPRMADRIAQHCRTKGAKEVRVQGVNMSDDGSGLARDWGAKV